jgi:HAD superfamily phosphoserine phosphatase-like hydrolase
VSDGGDKRGVAMFDLDGTLLAWDTQVLFCGHVMRQEGWRRWLMLPFFLLAPLAPILGTDGMKRVFLAYLWRLDRERLDELARGFVAEWFPKRCFRGLLKEIDRQREAGRRLVLASASPHLWVEEVGEKLGFDEMFGTVVEWGERAPFFPDLCNNKGAEKVRRLRLLGLAPEEGQVPDSHGYSDSTADLPMLEICQWVTVVNPGRKLEEIAEHEGWQVVRPGTPWKGRLGKGLAFLRAMMGW